LTRVTHVPWQRELVARRQVRLAAPRDRELRVVLDARLAVRLRLLDVRERDGVEAPDAVVVIQVADRIEELVLDRRLVVPRRVRDELAVELEVEERRLVR